MKKIVLFIGVLFCGFAISAPASLAMPTRLEGKIKLIGYMPAAHYIYIDKDETVTKVVCNTDGHAQPYVIDWQNKDGVMNDHIQRQYQQILAQNDNHLRAGHTYKLKRDQNSLAQKLAIFSWLRFKLAIY